MSVIIITPLSLLRRPRTFTLLESSSHRHETEASDAILSRPTCWRGEAHATRNSAIVMCIVATPDGFTITGQLRSTYGVGSAAASSAQCPPFLLCIRRRLVRRLVRRL